MQRIKPIDPAKATGKTRDQLAALERKYGRVPNVFATMAHAPSVLNAYLGLFDAMSHMSLDPRLRELLGVTVATANDSEYCRSVHTALGKNLGIDTTELTRAQEADSADPRIQAALRFARALVLKRGKVGDEEISDARAAGFNDAAILELVAAAVLNTFTNYLNLVAKTELDFPQVPVMTAEK